MSPLHAPIPSPERILTFGPAGSGKTTAWLDIAKWSARTNSPAKFYVLDTDFAVERMLTTYPEIVPNVEVYSGYDWNDYIKFQKHVLTHAKAGDWVIIDFIGSAWDAVQQYFTEQVFKQDIGTYFLQARKEGQKALEGWTDWSVINPLYKQWVNPLLFKGRFHVYATAKSDELSSDKKPTESKDIRSMFLPYSVKPKGQKDLPYPFHTLLLTGRDARGTRTLTTVKDRERTEVKGLVLNSFTVDYLKGIGGWELV